MKITPLTAWEELSIAEKAMELLPQLRKRGLSLEDSLALAHNTCTAFYALKDNRFEKPIDLLQTFSLNDIANICVKLETSEKEFTECGFNENFKEKDNL